MFDPPQLLRAHIQDMPAYEPILPFEVLSSQLGLPADQIVKLDANENPYGPLPQVQESLAALPYIHIYPDPESRHLRQALAEYHNLPAENLIAGAGADELIDLLMRALLEPGEVMLNCPPTFGMYAFDGEVNRALLVSVPRKADFSLDIEAIESATQRHNPKMIFLASPNNPDGSLTGRDTLERLLALPLLVVLDEAYIEFAAPGSSRLQDVLEYKNLVVLRTFSKWAGLAGMRIGYAALPDWLIGAMWKIKQPYNISVAASQAALASLKNAAQLQEVGARIVAERGRLFELLTQIPWLAPYPSQANFILCRVVGRCAAAVKASLAQDGILVRYFKKPGLDDHIRISVGKPEHSEALIAALRNCH
ncbi:histidinol-phosphate transaminase [Chloroflexota bacterium]